MESLGFIKLSNLWILSLEADAILHMQMEVLCVTLCYMEHRCCPLSLPFHTKLHQEYLISVLDRSTLETWQVSFSGKKPRGLFMVPSLHNVVLSSVVSLSHREDTHSGSSAGYAEMLGTIQCSSFIPWPCWISPHLDRCFWADMMFGMSPRLCKWNLSSILPSVRTCVPRGTVFMRGYCKLRSKLLGPQS